MGDTRIGTQVGGYTLTAPLGEGGMGQVFRALQPALGREVALKLLHDRATGSLEHLRRFRREVDVQMKLSHPNLVKVIDAGVEPGAPPWLALELVSGTMLSSYIDKSAPLPLEFLVPAAQQLAAGLAYLHAQGVVHRDLKPDNVLVSDDGVLKISDFGLARPEYGTLITQQGGLVGTVAYMAPEVARGGDAAAGSDVYALGLIFYEMATGRLPYGGKTLPEWVKAICDGAIARASSARPELPQELDDSIDLMLSKDPAARPAAGDVEAMLAELMAGQTLQLPAGPLMRDLREGRVDHPTVAWRLEQLSAGRRSMPGKKPPGVARTPSSPVRSPSRPALVATTTPPVPARARWLIPAVAAAAVAALAFAAITAYRSVRQARVLALLRTPGAGALEEAVRHLPDLTDPAVARQAVLARLACASSADVAAALAAAQALAIPPAECADALMAVSADGWTLDERTAALARGDLGVALSARWLEKLDAKTPMPAHLSPFFALAGPLPAAAFERAVDLTAHQDARTAKAMEALVMRQSEHVAVDAARWRARIEAGGARARRIAFACLLARGGSAGDAAYVRRWLEAPAGPDSGALEALLKHHARSPELLALVFDELLYGPQTVTELLRAGLEQAGADALKVPRAIAGLRAADRGVRQRSVKALAGLEVRAVSRALEGVMMGTVLADDVSHLAAQYGLPVLTQLPRHTAGIVSDVAAVLSRGSGALVASFTAGEELLSITETAVPPPERRAALLDLLRRAGAREQRSLAPYFERLAPRLATGLPRPEAYAIVAKSPFSITQVRLLLLLDDHADGGDATWKAIGRWLAEPGDTRHAVRMFLLNFGNTRYRRYLDRAAADPDPRVRALADGVEGYKPPGR